MQKEQRIYLELKRLLHNEVVSLRVYALKHLLEHEQNIPAMEFETLPIKESEKLLSLALQYSERISNSQRENLVRLCLESLSPCLNHKALLICQNIELSMGTLKKLLSLLARSRNPGFQLQLLRSLENSREKIPDRVYMSLAKNKNQSLVAETFKHLALKASSEYKKLFLAHLKPGGLISAYACLGLWKLGEPALLHCLDKAEKPPQLLPYLRVARYCSFEKGLEKRLLKTLKSENLQCIAHAGVALVAMNSSRGFDEILERFEDLPFSSHSLSLFLCLFKNRKQEMIDWGTRLMEISETRSAVLSRFFGSTPEGSLILNQAHKLVQAGEFHLNWRDILENGEFSRQILQDLLHLVIPNPKEFVSLIPKAQSTWPIPGLGAKATGAQRP